MLMKLKALGLSTVVAFISVPFASCGRSQPDTSAKPNARAETRNCENIRPEVIRIAATNGVNIIKIYDPKMITSAPTKISCSGRALVSSGQEANLFYRDYQDSDGDWLVEYSENKLD